MTSKKSTKKNKGITTDNLPVLRIGSRVRCTDDGVTGHITWANAVSVKIKWDDGEQVTWRRDSLAERPLEVLDPAGEEQSAEAMASAEVEQTAPTESPQAEVETVSPDAEMVPTKTAPSDTETATTEGASTVPEPPQEQTALTLTDETAAAPAKPKRRRKEPATPEEKKFSALDAAAQVLAEAGQAMNCQEMIAAMSERGYWTSPGGKTPQATLYSAILREITVKGAASRFVKAARGKFALANE